MVGVQHACLCISGSHVQYGGETSDGCQYQFLVGVVLLLVLRFKQATRLGPRRDVEHREGPCPAV